MNMPVQAPLWMPVIGGVFAILVVKQLFGGLGQNIMNPALAGRCFLLISFPGHMTNFAAPAAAHLVDTVSGATPLAAAKAGEQVNLLSMFLGNTAGTIGETSALALLIGGIFLVCIHVIDLNIPLIYIGTELLFALLFGGHGFEAQTIDELLLAKDASGATIGLVEIISTTEGYGGGMQFSMGIASDGTTKGISFLSLSETAGLGMRADTDDFKNQFKDKNVEAFSYTKSGASADDEIDALSGATLTTNAVTNGVNAGICCFNYCNESGLLSGEGGNS